MSQVQARPLTMISVARPDEPPAKRALTHHRKLPCSIANPGDDAERFFVGWWQRMHRGRRGLVTAALKRVVWPDANGESARYVWEVCKWPVGNGHEWTFVCWMIDGVGAWWRRFPSKQAALAYFRQPAAIVMRPRESSAPHDDAPACALLPIPPHQTASAAA